MRPCETCGVLVLDELPHVCLLTPCCHRVSCDVAGAEHWVVYCPECGLCYDGYTLLRNCAKEAP